MAVDFTRYSNFNADASYSNVKYGADAIMLEVEMNEMQNILDNKVSNLIKSVFGEGFYKTGSTLSYALGTVTFEDDKAFADGDILTISTLELALAEGESAYLDVWKEEVTYATVLKKFGNQQEVNTVTNYIQDDRLLEETTRRIQIQYDLVKTTGTAGHIYLPVCTINSGNLIDNRIRVGAIGGISSISKLYSSFTAIADDTTNCSINQPLYNPATDILDVYYQGAKQTPTEHYSLNIDGVSIDLTFTIDTGEIIRYEVLKID